jgi:uncharacterized membrane-anchored protein
VGEDGKIVGGEEWQEKVPYFPAHKTHFFSLKNVTQIRPVSYATRVSIISKLINTCASIIQHLYREIVKTTVKMILVAVTTILCVSMMNKLYYGC